MHLLRVLQTGIPVVIALLAATQTAESTLLQVNPLVSRFNRLLPGGGVFGGPPLTSPLTVRLPDDGQLFVGGGIALAVLARDPSDGSLTEEETFVDGEGGVEGLAGAVSVATSPSGDHVYAVGFTDDSVALFSRDLSGSLTFEEAFFNAEANGFGLDGASAVTVSPDGRHVYVTAGFANSITGFARDLNSGSLTFQQLLVDDESGVDGLGGAVSLAMDPNGLDIYVAAFADDAVSHFMRDPANGALEFVDAFFDGEGIVDGLDGATSIVVAPDGAGVYVAGFEDDAVVAFARDPNSGGLVFREDERDGTNRLVDLEGATSVAVSPDDRFVYASSCIDNAIVAFTRNQADATLVFLESETPDDLVRPQDITISPDGLNLYAADADGVLVFALDPSNGRIGGSERGLVTARIDDGSSNFRDRDSLPIESGTGLTIVVASADLSHDGFDRRDEAPASTMENAVEPPVSEANPDPGACGSGGATTCSEGEAERALEREAVATGSPPSENSRLPSLPVVIAVLGLLPALALLRPT